MSKANSVTGMNLPASWRTQKLKIRVLKKGSKNPLISQQVTEFCDAEDIRSKLQTRKQSGNAGKLQKHFNRASRETMTNKQAGFMCIMDMLFSLVFHKCLRVAGGTITWQEEP